MIHSGATWVRFPRFVGDAAMQLSVLRLLRQMGIGPLVVWGPAATVTLVEDHELVDSVLPERAKPGLLEMVHTLRQFRATRCIHFPKSLRPALAALLAHVPERIGVSESLAGFFNTVSGPFWRAEGPFMHRYHAVLAMHWPGLPPMPHADYDPGVAVPNPGAPYLCLMPGSTWPSKTWPKEYFALLARQAREKGLGVVVLGTPDERETCDFVGEASTCNLCGKTSLKEAAAWLRGAWAAVGNDSGLSHLAAACGTAIIAIYGATDPEGSEPWGPRSTGLRLSGIPCAPCFKPHCSMDGPPCLSGIPPSRVWDALPDLSCYAKK
jgi:heptosyltransferase II